MTRTKARRGDSLYKRSGSPFWWLRRMVSHPGVGEIRLSTRTTSEKVARRYDDLIVQYRDEGNFEPLLLLKRGHVSLHDLHAHRDPVRLRQLIDERTSPFVKPLLEEWFEHGEETANISASSMRRYRASWKHVEALGLLTETLRFKELDAEFVRRFKVLRSEAASRDERPVSKATINRDLAAIQSFVRWYQESRGLPVIPLKAGYFRESKGKDRYLTRDEIRAFQKACPADWWPLFALLFTTGISVGEALGLRSNDVNLATQRLSIDEENGRRVKRTSRVRQLAIPDALVPLLKARVERADSNAEKRLFPITYWPARRVWVQTCKLAKIEGATIHDARHTFAVHAVQQGVPEARLQKLLGHSHPGTTRRYASHSPEQFVAQDAERVSKSIGFTELSWRRQLLRTNPTHVSSQMATAYVSSNPAPPQIMVQARAQNSVVWPSDREVACERR